MKILFCLLVMAGTAFGQSDSGSPGVTDILNRVDANMKSDSRIFHATMTVHGKRMNRTIESKSYGRGKEDAFTEYLFPPRERGSKMLKLGDRLWIYSHTSDRVIKISGHMLRQSVMGSDLSYEDMMETREWTDIYTGEVAGEETIETRNSTDADTENTAGEEIIENRKTWVIDLKAKVSDTAYDHCRVWVDQERFVPLKEDLFAKSGRLLKTTIFSRVTQIQGRWFPLQVRYKDMLKKGEGTVFLITAIEFDTKIPAYIFSKASLRK